MSTDTPVKETAKVSEMEESFLLSNNELAGLQVIYPGMAERDTLNAFRDIRTRLLHKKPEGNFVVMVSSLDANASTSNFVAMNLAASIAMDENKSAIYLDCNLDAPHADKILQKKPEVGLTDYLDDENIPVPDIIFPSGLHRLRIVPVGNPRETAEEQFASQRMKQLIDHLSERYPNRYVVLDVPPVGSSVVARILAQYVDYAVLVVPFGKVTERQVLSGIDAVTRQRFAGLVYCD